MAPVTRRGPPRAATSKKADPNFEPLNNLGSKSLLLDIPPEIRNEIYDYVAHSNTKVVVHKGVVIPHQLARTCRLVRAEFHPVFKASGVPLSTTITAHVCNFDFRRLVTLLNVIAKHKSIDKKPRRQLNIMVELTRPSELQRAYLLRWLVRCDEKLEMTHFSRKYDVTFNWGEFNVTSALKVSRLLKSVTGGEKSNDDVSLHDAVLRSAQRRLITAVPGPLRRTQSGRREMQNVQEANLDQPVQCLEEAP